MRRRSTARWLFPVAMALAAMTAEPALACEVCYGKADSVWIDASRMGVWLLLGCIFAVQACFVYFFVYLWRRNRAFHDPTRRPRLVK